MREWPALNAEMNVFNMELLSNKWKLKAEAHVSSTQYQKKNFMSGCKSDYID